MQQRLQLSHRLQRRQQLLLGHNTSCLQPAVQDDHDARTVREYFRMPVVVRQLLVHLPVRSRRRSLV